MDAATRLRRNELGPRGRSTFTISMEQGRMRAPATRPDRSRSATAAAASRTRISVRFFPAANKAGPRFRRTRSVCDARPRRLARTRSRACAPGCVAVADASTRTPYAAAGPHIRRADDTRAWVDRPRTMKAARLASPAIRVPWSRAAAIYSIRATWRLGR